jgi:hypothetical protein
MSYTLKPLQQEDFKPYHKIGLVQVKDSRSLQDDSIMGRHGLKPGYSYEGEFYDHTGTLRLTDPAEKKNVYEIPIESLDDLNRKIEVVKKVRLEGGKKTTRKRKTRRNKKRKNKSRRQ